MTYPRLEANGLGDPRRSQVAGHVYHLQLRCELCDFVLSSQHSGPDTKWFWDERYCPNCIAKGIRSKLVRSLK